ncbi:hypothetical protein [Streptomyces sp. NPDC005507]|uniref:hypothetical protein n=1 Tax=unclassified Streptomyces TaxID=2593676 RepID=UPI0033BECA48
MAEAEATEDAEEPELPADGVIRLRRADGTLKTYRRTSRTVDDGLGFTVAEGSYEQWSFLNLAVNPPVVHPMHIHLAVSGSSAVTPDMGHGGHSG